MVKHTILVAAVAGLVLALATSANAAVIVYEGFGYNPSYADTDTLPATSGFGTSNPNILHGEPVQQTGTGSDTDAIGLAGTWVEKNVGDADNMFLRTGSLSFGDLATSGNRIGFKNNLDWDVNHRALTAAAQSAIGSASEIWFSILADKTYVKYSAFGGFVLANKVLSESGANGSVWKYTGADGLEGFGFAPPSTNHSQWTGYAWDGSSQSVCGATINGATSQPPILFVGHISFDTGTGGTDQYTLYRYSLNAGSIVGGTLNQIGSTMEVDVDQTALNTINITRNEATDYDELRIGTSLADVIVVPEPATMALLGLGGLGLILGRKRR